MFEKLKSLLATADYVGLSDAAAADLANNKRHSVTRDSYWTYRILAGRGGVGPDATRRLIATLDAVAASDPLVAEIRHSLRVGEGVNANDPATQAMLDAFAAHEQLPLTDADAAAIKALATASESDADRLGLGVVGDQHVVRARLDMQELA